MGGNFKINNGHETGLVGKEAFKMVVSHRNWRGGGVYKRGLDYFKIWVKYTYNASINPSDSCCLDKLYHPIYLFNIFEVG